MAATPAVSLLPTHQVLNSNAPEFYPNILSPYTRKLNPAKQPCMPVYTNTKANAYAKEKGNKKHHAAPYTSASETSQPMGVRRQPSAASITTSHQVAQESYSMAAKPTYILPNRQELNSNAPITHPNNLSFHTGKLNPAKKPCLPVCTNIMTNDYANKEVNREQHAASSTSANVTNQPMVLSRQPLVATTAISHPIAQSSYLTAAGSADSPLPTRQAKNPKEPATFPSSPSYHMWKLNPAGKSCLPAYTNTKANVYVTKKVDREQHAAPSTPANETNQPMALARQTSAGATASSRLIDQSSYLMASRPAVSPLPTRQALDPNAPVYYPNSQSPHTRS
jgi:hypothetical protein